MNTKKTGAEKKFYDITHGPNVDRLFDACKYAYNSTVKIPINFAIAHSYTAPEGHPLRARVPLGITDIQIAGIEHEDGSGESFNLHGYCKADPTFPLGCATIYKPYRFEAYYNAKTRKGHITFSD